MARPLAIDLFCGLPKTELLLRTNPAIKEFVAGRAENPDHVPLRVGDDFPRAIPLVLWLVGHLQNATFAAGFARRWQVRILSAQSSENSVSERAARVVYFLDVGLASVKGPALFARRFSRAIRRAVSSVRVGRRDVKMAATAEAVASLLRYIRLFTASSASDASLAAGGAIKFVGSCGQEWRGAICAKQIIHAGFIL